MHTKRQRKKDETNASRKKNRQHDKGGVGLLGQDKTRNESRCGSEKQTSAIPAFPGTQYILATRGLCAIFQQSACSRPPLPMTTESYIEKRQRHDTTQHNTTQHNTTQHNTTQHNTTQHNTTQHNTTQTATKTQERQEFEWH
jgi:hypothetical protein